MPNTSLYSSHQTKARAKPYALFRGPEALTNGIKWRQLTKNGLKTDRENNGLLHTMENYHVCNSD